MQGNFIWKCAGTGNEHTEELDQRPRTADESWDDHTPEQRAKALLNFYNSTLRPHETERHYIGVEDNVRDDKFDDEDIIDIGELAATDFFVPNDNFVNWLNSCLHLRYHPILDIGAGSGLMTKTISDNGFSVTGLDIHRRSSTHTMVQVVPDDIITDIVDKTTQGTGLFIARPCHSGFAQDYFKRHLSKDRLFAYYVGLEKNIEIDLPEMSYGIVAEDVGNDGENVYQVYGTKTDCKNLYTLQTWAGVYEWDSDNEEFVSADEKFGIPIGISRKSDCEVREAYIGVKYTYQRPPSIDKIKTTHDCGWIDPNGNHFRVPYTRHSEFIYDFLYLDETKDIDGWVKVWPKGVNDYDLRWSRQGDEYEPSSIQNRVMKNEFGVDHQRYISAPTGLIKPTRKGGF